MIVWQGYGWIAILIVFLPLFIGVGLANDLKLGEWPRLVGAWTGSLALVPIGLWMNRPRVTDTGVGMEQISDRSKHTLYWVPLQYVGPIFGVICTLLVLYYPAWR
jgi:hypothetical protein